VGEEGGGLGDIGAESGGVFGRSLERRRRLRGLLGVGRGLRDAAVLPLPVESLDIP
jgi:hypothetical protein